MPLSSTKPKQASATEGRGPRNAEEAAFRLTLLGPWDLTGKDGRRVQSVLSQPKRLCLLAYLALSARPVTRAHVVALFWPENDEDHARNALSQSLHYLRRSMGKRVIENIEGDRISVPAGFLHFDAQILLALEDGETAEITLPDVGDAATWRGDFFDGWNADGSQPLQDWLDATRLKVSRAQARIAVTAEDAAPGPNDPTGKTATSADGGVAASSDPSGQANDNTAASAAGLRWKLIAGVFALLVLVLLTMGWWGSRQERMDTSAGLSSATSGALPIAVLMPRLAGSGMMDSTSLQAIHAEIIHQLSPLLEPGDLHSVPFTSSPSELQRILEAQSDVPIPRRVTDVLVTVDGSTVRMNAFLLTGSSYVVVVATARGVYELESEADGMLRLPAWIAEELAAEFGQALAER